MKDPRRFEDIFAAFGPVHIRRMFGGQGLFAGEVMIGLVAADDTIFLKTDAQSRAAYVAEGSGPYLFHSKRAHGAIATSYYEVPERLYDEPEEFAEWARRAYAIAERSDAVQRKRRLTSRKSSARRPPKRLS